MYTKEKRKGVGRFSVVLVVCHVMDVSLFVQVLLCLFHLAVVGLHGLNHGVSDRSHSGSGSGIP
jgi:hypothetical protein